jgi:hypothetical protein
MSSRYLSMARLSLVLQTSFAHMRKISCSPAGLSWIISCSIRQSLIDSASIRSGSMNESGSVSAGPLTGLGGSSTGPQIAVIRSSSSSFQMRVLFRRPVCSWSRRWRSTKAWLLQKHLNPKSVGERIPPLCRVLSTSSGRRSSQSYRRVRNSLQLGRGENNSKFRSYSQFGRR